MSKQITNAIRIALGQECGSVKFDRSAMDWCITGIFTSDIPAVMLELSKLGLRRKQSASGFYVCK